MLYLFLDFDGVLHTHGGKRFSLVHNFAHVVKKYPDVKIVFSTSWREHSNLETLKEFLPPNIHEQCIGKTPWIKEDLKHPRYLEIQEYNKENGIADHQWIAVDDLASLFPPKCENLFLVNGREGISPMTAKILERKIKYLLRKINTIDNKTEDSGSKIATFKKM